ncbi:AfsR/SARP family transcriptional regulator [Actinomadura sp. BRA 177]|uniref:AfsR/SARP family transcriptional regulator n=1 Tax=Actinomadura sp. BRA 177 TaxID=2745202 RepID=UPI00159577C0|nr:AfsR/SARP family transcriptional regulator [Actinomadura sp. BRA 177]NVI91426.1 AfsR/SARP family transcriptional regulator [Actinomadura sp. BRA 177]
MLSLNSGDLDITPTAPKQRELLGLLLLKANQVVSFDSLVQELWEGSPPSDAVATMHAHMSQLRKVLHQRSDTHRLRTHERGYLFHCELGELDLHTALRHIRLGKIAQAAERARESVDQFSTALSMWPNPVLFDVGGGPVSASIRADLERERLQALHGQFDARLLLGEHHRILGDLRALVRAHPTDERLHSQLMTALYRCGRQVEALTVYTNLRHQLASYPGAVPSSDLERLHSSILWSKVESAPTSTGWLSLDLLEDGPATTPW